MYANTQFSKKLVKVVLWPADRWLEQYFYWGFWGQALEHGPEK